MKDGPDIAGLAALIGDPARANMLVALMSGIALTAGELAREAGITAQTASSHLSRLLEAQLVMVEVQGRHRYFRLAGPDVAGALEGLMDLAVHTGRLRTRPGPRNAEMREARVCYNHLAGNMGVRLHEALIQQNMLVATVDGLGLSASGRAKFIAEGIDIAAMETRTRPLCRACLDWSERRHHLAGALGEALLTMMMMRGWARQDKGSRALIFSTAGRAAFEAFLKG